MKILCQSCQQMKKGYGPHLCCRCYNLRKREAFLLHGISFPKWLCRDTGRRWTFEVIEP